MRTSEDIQRDIVAHPERDDLRLEFAAAIETRDPEWARYIRECFDPTWGRTEYDRVVPSIEARIEEPLKRLGAVSVPFSRGFPRTAQMPVETFLARGDEILSLAPILEVNLTLPDRDDRTQHWNTQMPALAACPALARVRELTLVSGWFDFECVNHLIGSPHIEKLLRLGLAVFMLKFDSPTVRDQQENEMWPLLLESPVFRRMLSWGILHLTRRQLGDRTTTETLIQYESSDRYRTTYHPMSEESRALEQKYGYIPCLHAGNWKATVLDVLRGLKPDFPAGAKPTEEMYDVPPPYEHL